MLRTNWLNDLELFFFYIGKQFLNISFLNEVIFSILISQIHLAVCVLLLSFEALHPALHTIFKCYHFIEYPFFSKI